jgi:hypothetical protein
MAEAVRLEKNAEVSVPPKNGEELYDRIRAGRKPWPEKKQDVMRRMQGR